MRLEQSINGKKPIHEIEGYKRIATTNSARDPMRKKAQDKT